MNDFMRCYTCGTILPQRSGGQCDLCNPNHGEDLGLDSDDDEDDYDWSVKAIDHRGPEPEDYEDNGEPILGSYILCQPRGGGSHDSQVIQGGEESPSPSPCEACQGIPSECGPCGCPEFQRATHPDPQDSPDQADYPSESLNEKPNTECGRNRYEILEATK